VSIRTNSKGERIIVFREANPEVNVIHLIMGPETDFQFDISGHIVLPIDDKIDTTKKNILYINKSISPEEEVRREFESISQKFMQELAHIQNEIITQKPRKNSEIKHGKQNSPQCSEGEQFISSLKCPKCLSWGTFIKNGKVTMCQTCKDIEKGKEIVTPLTKKEKKFFDNLEKQSEKE